MLSDICQSPVATASVPGGYYSDLVGETAAAAGIKFLFNSEPVTEINRSRDCLVLGRYSIQQGVSAATAASIASGSWQPRMRQFLFWNAKKVAKNLGGSYYIAARKSLLNRKPAA